ncbi:Hypothetical protein, putative [Bodo saltans]|uniref:Rab-GAP TBC domain-containing protein n=1 Tax=Bodo saltans TaxID=75058 RepID=A0A0S4INB4_BODSA|nr:Hypothetical protein, putative [Bodo saltans]|eukprot:CUE81812.1 Hypothetical protein, putative [Bodo saltans]
MYTMCLPMTRVGKLQRKSNLRGKRIVTVYRVGGGVECPLIFQDGGMTKLFDELKKVCTVRQVPNSVDEFTIEDKNDIDDDFDIPLATQSSGTQRPGATAVGAPSAGAALRMSSSGSTAPETAAAGAPHTKRRMLVSDGAGGGGSDDYVDPNDFRKELYAERPAGSAGASSTGPLSPSPSSSEGSAAAHSSGPASAKAATPAKAGMMKSLLSFGANLTQRGSKIAGNVIHSVTSVADDLMRDESSGSGGDFEVVEPIAHVEELVPTIAHLTHRKAMREKVSRVDWDAGFAVAASPPKEKRMDPPAFNRLREKAYFGGVEDGLRAELWAYLLELYPVTSSIAERDAIDVAMQREYETMKLQWVSLSEEQEKRHSGFRERKTAIEKDVIRTDRFLPEFAQDDSPKLRQLHDCLMTYAMYNFDLGYCQGCQGMSDIMAVMALLYHEEWKIFAMFRQMMSLKCEGNFRNDVKSNMEKQLQAVEALVRRFAPALHQHLERHHAHGMTFCFRWLLILFKREFSVAETMLLWDVLISSPYTPQFEVFVTGALLRGLSGQVVEQSLTYDELLKFANALSGNIPVKDVIILAQEFYEVVTAHVAWKERLQGLGGGSGGGQSAAANAG